MLDEEVVTSFIGIIANPYAAFEVLHPAVTDDRVGTEAVLESFAYLVGTVTVVVTLIINCIQIQTLDA